MTITTVNPLGDEQWDARIDGFAGNSFFHGTPWLRVLHDCYAFSPCYILSTDTTGSCAVLPMMEVDSWLTGKRGVSLPFTDECAPLGGHESELFEAAVALGRERRWKRIELRSDRIAHGIHGEHGSISCRSLLAGDTSREKSAASRVPQRAAINDCVASGKTGIDCIESAKLDVQPSVTFYGHRLQLQPNTAELFANCDSSTRRAVRKAEQTGVQIEFSRSLEAVRTFYALLQKTRQRHGAPPQPFGFFRKLHQHAIEPGHGWVVLARLAGVPIAGAVFLHSKRDAIYKYGASDESYQHARGNNLVMWRAIEWYAQNSFNSLDFGRTSLGNDGLRRFKLGWGTAERMVHYFQYNLRTNRFDISRDAAAGWQTHVFRRLPRWASQLIGTALYKHTA